jgi:hypothetical protein
MPQRFVICTDSGGGEGYAATTRERNKITRLLQSKGWRIWHWFEDVWLVVNPSEERYSTDQLQLELRTQFIDDRYVLILEVTAGEYSGFGPKKAWPWMRKNWDDDMPA